MVENLAKTRKIFEKQLVSGELDFWLGKGLDFINGGIYTALDEKGDIIDTDKSVWFQGRALWIYSKAYEKYGDIKYLKACDNLVSFIDEHCFDADGRMFFKVSEQGNPVVKRIRYFSSEVFAIIGYAAYAKITKKNEYSKKALELLQFVKKLRATKSVLIPKSMRPSKVFADTMILLNVTSELILSSSERALELNKFIDELIQEIKDNFIKEDLKLILEQVNSDGSFQRNHFDGRITNPGHAIEAAWFIMKIGTDRKSDELKNLGVKIYDWMFEEGWDKEYGGIIQYTDALNMPIAEYHSNMKFWWPQCEALIASLYAYKITEDEKYLEQFNLLNEYVQTYFVDTVNGEWFGYLRRDGSLSTTLKGNFYKGPFHIPRMYMVCLDLIEEIIES